MHLDVHLEREGGVKVETIRDFVGVADFVRSRCGETVCMRFIDPYGDTVFNRGQCVVLREEWAVLASDAPEAVAGWVSNAAGLIERGAADMHLYVRFSGD